MLRRGSFEYEMNMRNKNYIEELTTSEILQNGSFTKFENKKNKKIAHKKPSILYECHHCKTIQPEEYFVPCTRKYQSSPDIKNNLKNAFLGFRNGGDTTCSKKFCRNCMKHIYFLLNKDTDSTPSCPFCDETCFCSRCQTRDNIVKFVKIYENCGGDREP